MSESDAGGSVDSTEGAGVSVAQLKAGAGALAATRPEVAVLGAFVGGLIVAMLFRRLGS